MNTRYRCQLPLALGAAAFFAGAAVMAVPAGAAHAQAQVAVPNLGAARNANAGMNGSAGLTRANSAISANGGADSAVNRNGNEANGSAAASAGGEETLGMWQDRVRAQNGVNASANAGVRASERGESPRTEAMEAKVTAASIGSTSFDARSDLRSEIREQITAGNKALAEARHDASRLDKQAKTAFKASVEAVEDAETQLKADMKAAKSATADDWAGVRSKLAADYAAYQAALAAAVSTGEVGESASGSESAGSR